MENARLPLSRDKRAFPEMVCRNPMFFAGDSGSHPSGMTIRDRTRPGFDLGNAGPGPRSLRRGPERKHGHSLPLLTVPNSDTAPVSLPSAGLQETIRPDSGYRVDHLVLRQRNTHARKFLLLMTSAFHGIHPLRELFLLFHRQPGPEQTGRFTLKLHQMESKKWSC